MKMEEYLNKVTEQMRCKKAHASVVGELEHHILDQMEAYKKEGLEEEEALDKAIIEMGDPVEVGVSLDRIHRPQISWSMLVLIALISILGIVLQFTLISGQDSYMGYMAERQTFFVAAGYIGMLIIYFLDYSFLGKYATSIGTIFLLFLFVTRPFRIAINGSQTFLRVGVISFSIPLTMALFVPIFGAILFQYRGQGYRAVAKSVIWISIATLITLEVSLPYAFFWGISMVALFLITVWKEWFAVNRKKVLGMASILIVGGTAVTVGITATLLQKGILHTYQAERIKAFMTRSGDSSYVVNRVAQILGDSELVGGNPENIKLVTLGLPGADSELVFVSIVACYGMIAGILVAGLMTFMLQKIFRISFGQKNQLGMIVGCGCGMVLGTMAFFSIIQSLGLFPITAVILPFFSRSGSGTLVFYILLGLVLSIYRYQNIPMSNAKRNVKRLRIRFE